MQARIKQLESERLQLLAEIYRLQARIFQLELLKFDPIRKRILNLTFLETRFVLTIFDAKKPLKIFSRAFVRETVWPSRETSEPLVAVMVHKCNAKFEALGVEKAIVTFWGQGIGLTSQAHALVNKALEEDAQC